MQIGILYKVTIYQDILRLGYCNENRLGGIVMIKLDVEDYCDTCPDFEPTAEKIVYQTVEDSKIKSCDTVVSCKLKERCASIEKYMKMRHEKWGSI